MTEAAERLVATFREFGGADLRDVWLFDQWVHERLFVREDVAATLVDVDVVSCVDNERYGFVTRDTYEQLYSSDYEYTVRTLSTFKQFRTFLDDDGDRVGVFASFDRSESHRDFDALADAVADLTDGVAVAELRPTDDER
jgi:hypothetical protein